MKYKKIPRSENYALIERSILKLKMLRLPVWLFRFEIKIMCQMSNLRV